MTSQPTKRSKLFVDSKVQGALAIRIALHWLLFFVVSMMCIFALEYFLGDPGLTFQEHGYVVWQKYAFFILLMLTIVPSFVYDAIKLSNRFAGPMVRLKKNIKAVANGEQVEHIQFRDGDFWVEVCEDFNQVTDRMGVTKQDASDEATRDDQPEEKEEVAATEA